MGVAGANWAVTVCVTVCVCVWGGGGGGGWVGGCEGEEGRSVRGIHTRRKSGKRNRRTRVEEGG